jgi:IclR family KDG regulon transcriptional repressor
MALPDSPPPASSADSGTVNRTLRILSALATKNRWSVNELARALSLPRASTHRLLSLCKPLGYVEQDADGLYTPGVELYRIAGSLSAQMPINQLADPLLQAVCNETDETALLVLLARQDRKMFFSSLASPPHPLRYTSELNRLEPLTWGAAGQSLLAFLTQDEIDAVLDREEASPLDGRALDVTALRDTLATVRKQGYAVSYSERAPDMHGIAVPFFDASGAIRGSLMLTIPHFRFDNSRLDRFIALLRHAADELMRRLGWA